MARGDSYQLQGQQGGIVLTAGDSAAGNFRWIQVINDTIFSSLGSTNIDEAANLLSITIPAGIGIGGKFTSIEVSGASTGVVIAYYE